MRKHEAGFSLIELLAMVSLVAIGLGLGAPAFTNVLANTRMSGAVNDVVATLHAARSAAITRGDTVTVCAAPGGEAPCSPDASFALGWIVFVDRNADASLDEGEDVLQSHAGLPPALLDYFSAGSGPDAGNYIAFNAAGQIPPTGTPLAASLTDLQFCDSRGNVSVGGGLAAGRWVQILPIGRPRIVAQQAQLQSGPLGGC